MRHYSAIFVPDAVLADLESLVADELGVMADDPRYAAIAEHHDGDDLLRQIAIENVGSKYAARLLWQAMAVARRCCVLGTADGDGEGGAWMIRLREIIDEILEINREGRVPAPKGKSKSISSVTRGRVLQRDGDRCQHCGATDDLAIDHIYPASKGGTDDIDNLQVLCRSCNSRKGVRV